MISFLFVDTEPVWRGGQDQLLALLRGLLPRGHRIHLICNPRTLLERRARDVGVSVYPLRIRNEAGLGSLVSMISILRRIKPDILVFNTPKPILLGNLASRFSGIKKRIIFRRVIFPLRKNLLTRLKYRWGIDCIVAISECIRRQLQSDGIPGSLIRTIHEGIDLSLYPERRSAKPKESGMLTTAGTIAHLSSEKGLNYLVEAAARIPEVQTRLRFVLVGDGPCRAALEQQVRERGLQDCFSFVGFQEQPIPYLSSFDLFVFPSLSEGLSTSILAAMASSLPIVASHVGGIPELVRDGENGILVPPADPEALAQAIQRLANHPEEASRMGQQGRMRVEKQFTLPHMTDQIEQLCNSLLSGPNVATGDIHG
jgi:glycosyltransferase involved in cell wall biosynthesis